MKWKDMLVRARLKLLLHPKSYCHWHRINIHGRTFPGNYSEENCLHNSELHWYSYITGSWPTVFNAILYTFQVSMRSKVSGWLWGKSLSPTLCFICLLCSSNSCSTTRTWINLCFPTHTYTHLFSMFHRHTKDRWVKALSQTFLAKHKW